MSATIPTTTADIRAALARHWRPAEYLVLEECPQDAMRQGRKIDVLVIALWRSRGHELDAIEIKVSLSDWMKEVNNPEKADWWWHHSHRFWVAVPASLAAKVRETLPTGWGLLAVGESGVGTIVKATKHDAVPLPWTAIVGTMRCASGAGANALLRERSDGESAGYKRAKAEFERTTGEAANRRALDALREKVDAFNKASGLNIHDEYQAAGAERLGELVAIVRAWSRNPTHVADGLRETAKRLGQHADGLTELAAALLPTNEYPEVQS